MNEETHDTPPNPDASTTPEATDAVAVESPEQTVARLQNELNEAKDRALRAQAELENSRKRMRREMDEDRRYAEVSLLGDLLPVVDNLARALSAADKNAEGSGLAEGVKLVAQQLDGVLSKHHCLKIDAAGKPFDPNLHAAMMQQPTADVPPNTVVSVFQDGYQVHDRVIRPAQVVVSKPADA